jgi:diacylglycerol kinase family enzyme
VTPPPESALDRAEELAERVLPSRGAKRRMLIIVNPYASTVSDRLKNLVVYALQGRYSVEAVDTQAKAHAIELTREAAQEGYDVVVAFGGDGTVNEAANGLRGSETPLTVLPGGSTNVYCRTLGIPEDVVDATEHLLRMADSFEPRRVDVGLMNGRCFVASSGIGLDASVVERVDAHPKLKARLSEYYFTYAAISTFNRKYLIKPPQLSIEAAGERYPGVTMVVQVSDPYTYFASRPIRICRDVDMNDGRLGAVILKKATPFEIPTVLARVFSAKPETVAKHRQIESLTALERISVVTADGRPLPVQVDGDHVGDFEQIEYAVDPGGLAVVS